jgi:DNA-binding LytR/AlgR family response regulator
MLRVAVVEDNKRYSSQLKHFVERYGEENNVDVAIKQFSDGMEIVEGYKPVWDIILLDIEMPHLNGMSAAEEIRRQDEDVILIFITNIAQYAIQGYAVNALDYVLKPVTYAAFALKMRKACNVLEKRETQAVILSVDGESKKIMSSDILYVEVADHELIYHTKKGDFHEFGTLKKVEELLGKDFTRCNHCYLVNLRYVEGIRDDCVVIENVQLKISRSRKKEMLQKISDYYRYGGR